jgi:hypothetical protein
MSAVRRREAEASPSGLESTWRMVVAMGVLLRLLFLRAANMAGRAHGSNPPEAQRIVAQR